MTITKVTYPERVLIVLEPDGTMRGAHVERITVISEDGNVLQTQQEPPEPVNATTLAGILPSQGTLISQVEALTNAAEQAAIDKAASDAEHAAAIAASNAARDAALARVAALEAQLHPVDANGFAVLTPVQFLKQLEISGFGEAVIMEALKVIPNEVERRLAYIDLVYRLEYRRDHPRVQEIATLLGLTSEQVDAMWRAASLLN